MNQGIVQKIKYQVNKKLGNTITTNYPMNYNKNKEVFFLNKTRRAS
jgi:hypothetical protein